MGTHQAAPDISKQSGPLVAEGGGEDVEVCFAHLYKIGSAAGLRHQGVTEGRQKVNN